MIHNTEKKKKGKKTMFESWGKDRGKCGLLQERSNNPRNTILGHWSLPVNQMTLKLSSLKQALVALQFLWVRSSRPS